jgi:drug/metabolite transporter (DMT)-like permease
MIFGLGAAFGWGCADLLAAVVSRRMGSFLTLLVAQLAGVVSFTVLAALAQTRLDGLTVPTLFALFGIGVLLAVTYGSFYRALELGPLALVSPIAASYAAIVIALAILVLGESLATGPLVGALITLLGVIIASTDRRASREDGVGNGVGVAYAIVAMVGFGISLFLLSRYARELGWITPALVSRAGTAVVLAGVFGVRVIRATATDRSWRAGPRHGIVILLVAGTVGLLDTLGLSSYSRGSELGFVSIVAAASATYPLIPMLAGVLLFGERVQRHQGFGVVLVLVGLLLLALG